MRFRHLILYACLLTATIAAGGCATRGDVDALGDQIDALANAEEAKRRQSAEALETARLARTELAELREMVARAASDSAALRQTLDALDKRMALQTGSGSLK